MFRMFSQSVEMEQVPPSIVNISNLANGLHHYPPLSDLYKYKVVICTLTTAGRFVQAGIKRTHFTHVFVDECGSATETQSLIAVAGKSFHVPTMIFYDILQCSIIFHDIGLCTSSKRINACVVFAGDPKQLGPVIKCPLAEKMGYGLLA